MKSCRTPVENSVLVDETAAREDCPRRGEGHGAGDGVIDWSAVW